MAASSSYLFSFKCYMGVSSARPTATNATYLYTYAFTFQLYVLLEQFSAPMDTVTDHVHQIDAVGQSLHGTVLVFGRY